MFPHMTPEMLKFINSSRLESVPTFEEYFEKRYLEECKYLVENPRFSISHMIFASKLRENVRRMALEEYKKKYPLSQIILKSKSESNLTSIPEETKSECGDGFEEITVNELGAEPSSEPTEAKPSRPRRSARLNKKSTN